MDDGNDLQARQAQRPTSMHGGHFVARSLTARLSVAVEWQGGKNKSRVTKVAAGQAAPVGCEFRGLFHRDFWGENPPSTENRHTNHTHAPRQMVNGITQMSVTFYLYLQIYGSWCIIHHRFNVVKYLWIRSNVSVSRDFALGRFLECLKWSCVWDDYAVKNSLYNAIRLEWSWMKSDYTEILKKLSEIWWEIVKEKERKLGIW